MNTILELIIDYSNSMGPLKVNEKSYLLPDGSTRMNLAKTALINDIIPTLDYTGLIGIRTFFSKEKKAIIETVFEGTFDKNVVISKIQALIDPIDTGGTPISAALQSSIDFLKKISDSDKKIFLITDGEENDGSDFKMTIESGLNNHQIDYNIFIIGIGQNDATAEKCKLLSESTKGGYVNLETANYDKEKLSNILRPLSFKALSSSIENVQESNQKVISAISSNIIGTSKEFQKSNEFDQEIIKALAGHAHSIELINKQLINLDGASISIDKNLASIKGQIASLSTGSDLQTWVKNIEENSLESLSKIHSTIDQANITIQDSLKVTNLQSADFFKNLDEKISIMKNDMADIQKVVQLIEGNTSKLLSKRNNETRIFQTLFLVALIIIGFLSFIVFRRLL